MITLMVSSLAVIVILAVILALLSVPVMIILALAPWALAVVGIMLGVKALTEKPVRWESFMPAVGAFLLAGVIRWFF